MSLDFLNCLPTKAKTTKSLIKGELLFRQDDATFALFLMQQGQIQLIRHTKNGDPIIIHHAHVGETFAEVSLFSNQHHCDAVAQENVTIDIYAKTEVLTEMQKNPEFFFLISEHFARQIQTYRRRLEINAIRNAEQRIYTVLSEGLLTADIKSFAAKIALSHEATYRGLAKLVKQGKLSKPARGSYSLI